MGLPRFLTPITTPDLRPDPEDPKQHDAVVYVRSLLWMRIVVGVAGLLLPVLLVSIDDFWFRGDPAPRGSMSAYYWSGMHDVFVTAIFAIGAFLLLYKIAEVNLDNTASIIAGAGAMCLAWFPASPHDNKIPLPVPTPLEDHWGLGAVSFMHHLGTGAFVVFLALVSYFFGVREGKQPPVPGKLQPAFWRWYHKLLAGAMVVGLVVVLWDVFKYHTLVGEVICLGAFAASWLAKGTEWDMLRGRPVEGRRRPEDSSAAGNPEPPGTHGD